jgi:hypothetical protein
MRTRAANAPHCCCTGNKIHETVRLTSANSGKVLDPPQNSRADQIYCCASENTRAAPVAPQAPRANARRTDPQQATISTRLSKAPPEGHVAPHGSPCSGHPRIAGPRNAKTARRIAGRPCSRPGAKGQARTSAS